MTCLDVSNEILMTFIVSVVIGKLGWSTDITVIEVHIAHNCQQSFLFFIEGMQSLGGLNFEGTLSSHGCLPHPEIYINGCPVGVSNRHLIF